MIFRLRLNIESLANSYSCKFYNYHYFLLRCVEANTNETSALLMHTDTYALNYYKFFLRFSKPWTIFSFALVDAKLFRSARNLRRSSKSITSFRLIKIKCSWFCNANKSCSIVGANERDRDRGSDTAKLDSSIFELMKSGWSCWYRLVMAPLWNNSGLINSIGIFPNLLMAPNDKWQLNTTGRNAPVKHQLNAQCEWMSRLASQRWHRNEI